MHIHAQDEGYCAAHDDAGSHENAGPVRAQDAHQGPALSTGPRRAKVHHIAVSGSTATELREVTGLLAVRGACGGEEGVLRLHRFV